MSSRRAERPTPRWRAPPRTRSSLHGLTATFTSHHRGGSGPPLVCIHGFTDTWRTWDLVLPGLERAHDVLAPTLPGHAGGPPLAEPFAASSLADAVERSMDAAGFGTAHLVGNSLGGMVALELAARGRARSVVAFAPAGGWERGDDTERATLSHFSLMLDLVAGAAPHVDAILATPEGRRRATESVSVRWEHIPTELLAHQILGVAGCAGARRMIEYARREGWQIPPGTPDCPVRLVWGESDRLLPWPRSAARFRSGDWASADWEVLEDVGHCPQLDVPAVASELVLEFTGRL